MLALVWDDAPWHVSRAVRAWIAAHDRRVKRDGRLYVGAAYGEEGLYGRWLEHATAPDPIELQKVEAKDLTVSILELTDPAWNQAALEAEARWKELLRPALCAN